MAIEINLTPEDIERLVKDSIMKSGFGAAVTEAVKRTLASGYDNPIEKAVKAYVTAEVDGLLRTEFGDKIRAAVLETMQKRVTAEVMQKFTDVAIDKIVRAASDRY